MNNFYLANWVPGREDRQLEAVEEALTLSGAGLPIGDEIVARIHRLACLQRLGRLTDFDVEVGRVGALADRLRVAEFSAEVALLQAGQATLRGDGDAARRHCDVGLELQRRTSIAGAEVNHFVCLSMVDRCHGADGDHADDLYDAAQDPAKGILRPLAILALAEAGRHDAAIALLDRWYTPPTRDWAGTWITAHWALIATERGVPAAGVLDAAMLYRCLEPGAEHLAAEGTGIVFGGSMHTILAGLAWRCGDHANALRHAELGMARDAARD